MPTVQVSTPTRFLIGISAGFIAASMPQISGLLASSPDGVSYTVFTSQFITSVAVFSIIIGVAMVWLYMDSIETSKNLFMSALALPAVLSGGISMSSVSQDAETQISQLSQDKMKLENQLMNDFNFQIETLDSSSGNSETTGSVIPLLLGINNAYAESGKLKKDLKWQANTHFKTKSLDRDYYLLFDKSTDRKKLTRKKDQLTRQNSLKQLDLYSKGKKSYLIQNIPRTRSEALLAAIALKKQKIKVKILHIK